ncbi:MAG: hypothetical protein KBS60_04755, partial [Phascolarctobacterium sp.]|nr:hypothetical protein [Candidatus Phascolarctobacterium caballi]
YSNAKFVDSNSFVSVLVGEGNLAQDYFGYGKTKVSTPGSGALAVDLGSFADSTDTNGYALTFFNEYGNGTSAAGKFNVLPGTFRADASKNLIYTIAADKVAQNVQIGKNNVVELTGTGELTKNITGEGKVSVNGNITANGDKMQADFETASGKIMNISGGDVKGSLKGNFALTADTSFSGKGLQGYINSSSNEKLTLNNDVQINGSLEIANLDGNGKTLNMQQTGTASYDYLTIDKLWGDANLAIDVGKYSGSDVFISDKIDLNGADTGKKITLTAINLIDDPNITTFKDITGVVSGSAKGSVVVATGLELYGANNIYTASLSNGTLTLTYKEANNAGLKGFLENANGSSYSFRNTLYLGDVSDPPDAVRTAGAYNYTKTVFMNGNELRGYGENSKNGIVVDGTNHHTLSLINGKITNFDTALTVEEGATLILENVQFPLTANNLPANHTDVENNGTMNIKNTATIYSLAGSGTTNVTDSSILNLFCEGDLSQKFTGSGLLELKKNVTIAADNLAVAETNIGYGVTLTGGADDANRKTLQSTITGNGVIKIDSNNFVQADAANLGVAVENKGNLKLGSSKEMILTKDITGDGTLEFAQNTRINSTVTQGAIIVAAAAAIDVYKDLTATSGITNNGSILIDIDNLKNNVTNVGNGTVYLRNLGTAASKTLTKTITNGKVIVMNDVISSLQNLDNTEVCLAGGANLTLRDGGTLEIGINIKGYGSGAGTLITDCDGSTGTGYFYRATMDNIQVPLVNRGTLELNKGSTPGVNMMTGKMDSITNSGTLSIGADITLDRNISNSGTLNINGCLFSGEMTNSGKVTFKRVEGGTTAVCTITGTINNSGTVEIKEGNTFDTTAKVIGGILNLKGDYTFSNDNIQGLTELNVNGATYNFNAELGATPSVELIDAEKVTGATLNLGTVTPTWNENLSEWELGETKIAQYAKSTDNIVAVGNTAVVFSGDNHRFTFSQAKEDNGANKFGYLAIIKENGGELWQIIRNTEVRGYHCGNVATYSLTADYTEQMKDATTDTDKLGTLTRTDDNPREFTIEGNNHFFAGGADGADPSTYKEGITVGNAGDVLNFNNISEIKNWKEYVVTNNGGTVNFNNVTKLSSPVTNTSGTVNFSGTTEVNSTLSGSGTFNNNGELTVADLSNLDTSVTELHNIGVVNVGNDTDQTLNTKINGGALGIIGNITADSVNLAAN